MSRTAVVVFALAACSSPAQHAADAPVDMAMIDTALPDGWQSLVQGNWSLAPGTENYFCVYATVPRDVYIKALRPLSPLGTHHTVLTLYQGSSPPDGVVPCDFGTNGQNMIFGSGVGAPDFTFPSGVGLHLVKGQRLLLNLHMFNTTDQPLAGTSGTLFQEATAAEVANVAELVLAGPTFGLSVPPGVSTQSGPCHISNITSQPIQVFALSQHMHKLGTHMRSVIARGTASFDLQDVAYNFEQQSFQLTPSPITLMPGDLLTTSCTYNNPTTNTVTFGESTNNEMCFTDLFYYPAQGASFICTN